MRRRTHIDHPQVTSTPFPEPDRFLDAQTRQVYTRVYGGVWFRMCRPLFIFRVRMQDRPL